MNNLIKEVIQPQVPLRLPCYDLTPVMKHTVVSVPQNLLKNNFLNISLSKLQLDYPLLVQSTPMV